MVHISVFPGAFIFQNFVRTTIRALTFLNILHSGTKALPLECESLLRPLSVCGGDGWQLAHSPHEIIPTL